MMAPLAQRDDRAADQEPSQRVLARALDVLSEGFVLFDQNERLLLWNGPFARMYPALGRRLARGLAYDQLWQAIDGCGGSERSPRNDCRPGETSSEIRTCAGRWILVREQRSEDGIVAAIHTDITDIKDRELALRISRKESAEAKELAEQAARAKSDFLASMSHELRTPLNAIIGFSDMIRSQMLGPISVPAYRDYLEHIHSAGHHLLGLINDILDLSKLEAGKVQLDLEAADINEIIGEALTMVEPEARRKSVRVLGPGQVPLPRVLVDLRRMRQVLLNLLSNAIKFTPGGGTVRVSAGLGESSDLIVLRIADTGIGIAESQIVTVLEPFQQTAEGRSAGGTGLGLSISQRLLQTHGGSLAIESSPGVGTTVSIFLPHSSGASDVA